MLFGCRVLGMMMRVLGDQIGLFKVRSLMTEPDKQPGIYCHQVARSE